MIQTPRGVGYSGHVHCTTMIDASRVMYFCFIELIGEVVTSVNDAPRLLT